MRHRLLLWHRCAQSLSTTGNDKVTFRRDIFLHVPSQERVCLCSEESLASCPWCDFSISCSSRPKSSVLSDLSTSCAGQKNGDASFVEHSPWWNFREQDGVPSRHVCLLLIVITFCHGSKQCGYWINFGKFRCDATIFYFWRLKINLKFKYLQFAKEVVEAQYILVAQNRYSRATGSIVWVSIDLKRPQSWSILRYI